MLRHDRKYQVLDGEPPDIPDGDALEADKILSESYQEDGPDVPCIMLYMISPESRKHNGNMKSREIDLHLHELSQEKARAKKYKISRAFLGLNFEKGTLMGFMYPTIIGYIEKLLSLRSKKNTHLVADTILFTPPPSFTPFMMNFNKNNDMNKSMTLSCVPCLECYVGRKDQQKNDQEQDTPKDQEGRGIGKFVPEAQIEKDQQIP